MHRGKNLRRMTGRLTPLRRHAYCSSRVKSTPAPPRTHAECGPVENGSASWDDEFAPWRRQTPMHAAYPMVHTGRASGTAERLSRGVAMASQSPARASPLAWDTYLATR